MLRAILNFLVVFLFLCVSFLGTAQPPGAGGGNCPNPPCNTGGGPQVPISGIEFLLAAGAMIGLKFFRKKRD